MSGIEVTSPVQRVPTPGKVFCQGRKPAQQRTFVKGSSTRTTHEDPKPQYVENSSLNWLLPRNVPLLGGSVKPPGSNGIRLEGSTIEKAIKMVPNLHSKLTLDEEVGAGGHAPDFLSLGIVPDQCYELPESNGIFVKLIITSVTIHSIGGSNRFIASRAQPIFMQGLVIEDPYGDFYEIS
ncbi:hypothetical protein RND71_036925 [Anisodus tanguticus]|uniref:Uncharacterized protein n=1 Tax=Anisodus tanguticus TaxID=243964 RepID=A0AAE1R2J2_9SOLA|nr:hypothetical protein RND71_036925 [Anisodus tanguticus]